MEWKYTKERPLRVFEAFAGYGSQSLALRNIGIPYEVVGISEIDTYAIRAYEAIHGPTKNYGDISKIDWNEVPDFDLLTWSSPCTDFSNAGKQAGGGRKAAERAPPFSGKSRNAWRSRSRNTLSPRMSAHSSARNSFPDS